MSLVARRALVLVNQKSRQGDQDLSVGLDRLRAHGMALTVVGDASPSDLAGLIARHGSDHDLVIVGGGDGTMNAVAGSLVEHRLPLAILPLGTANDLARTLAIPLSLPEAFGVILDGDLRPIDLARVNGRWFFNVASTGLGAQVPRFHRGQRKRRLKLLSYILSLVDAFKATRTFRARIAVDGTEHHIRAIHVAVGNGRHYGGGMTVMENASIDDHTLDVYILRPQTLAQLALLAPALRRGTHRTSGRTLTFRARHVTIETDRPQAINADGEIIAQTPAGFIVVPEALRVVVPRRSAQADVSKAAGGG